VKLSASNAHQGSCAWRNCSSVCVN